MNKKLNEIISDIYRSESGHLSKLTYPSKQHCENDAEFQALLNNGFYILGDNSKVIDQENYEVYITISPDNLSDLIDLKYEKDITPGDYICYLYKNELGRVKRLNPYVEKRVFAWFHTGDTAANIDYELFNVVLTNKEASKMSEKEIKDYLHAYEFSNDYAVDSLVERNI